jgi:GT2 family glycosyltransferase
MRSSLRQIGADSGRPVERASAKRVFVLVLNWNNWMCTLDCLASLGHLDYENCKVIVIDNGSTDASVEQIGKRFPDVEIIQLAENVGFAGGNNEGIRVALGGGADYVWLLNNDTIVDRKALRAMVDRAEQDPKIGAVGSAIYSIEDRQQLQAWGGGYVNFWLGRSRHFLSPVPDEKIEFLTGASLLLRRSVLESVGLLDEGFFLYWEDADYCAHLRRTGWRLAVAGDSKVWHKENATVGKKSPLLDTEFNKAAVRFFARHAPVPMFSVFVGTGLRLAKRALAGDWRRFRAVWSGFRKARLHERGIDHRNDAS